MLVDKRVQPRDRVEVKAMWIVLPPVTGPLLKDLPVSLPPRQISTSSILKSGDDSSWKKMFGEPEHKRIEDLDSGLVALQGLVPNDWSSANPCAAEVLDITCQYIKHQKQNERKNIATWEREIATLCVHAESLEKKCEELSKDKESLAKELERVKGEQLKDADLDNEGKRMIELKENAGTKGGREADDNAEEKSDGKKPRIKDTSV
ncbi:hypothetical protein BDZ89DRAFT_1157318 [Hymenopellis radicata]|nr:hypothetical protein BDZ89DRAFT_1157318 [Hymenopellis radicata]